MSTDPSNAPARPRRGRRPGPSDSRQQVLNAARARFTQDGYAAATIRKIAADAGVDAALVMQEDPAAAAAAAAAAVRAGPASTMLIGVIVSRRIVQVPILVDEDRETIIALVGPAIQAVLTGRAAEPC